MSVPDYRPRVVQETPGDIGPENVTSETQPSSTVFNVTPPSGQTLPIPDELPFLKRFGTVLDRDVIRTLRSVHSAQPLFDWRARKILSLFSRVQPAPHAWDPLGYR